MDCACTHHSVSQLYVHQSTDTASKSHSDWFCRDAHFRAQFQASIVSIRRQGQKLKGKLGDVKLQSGDELLFDCGDNFDEHSDIVKANLTLIGLVQDDHVREFMVAFEVQGTDQSQINTSLPASQAHSQKK